MTMLLSGHHNHRFLAYTLVLAAQKPLAYEVMSEKRSHSLFAELSFSFSTQHLPLL